MALQGLVLHGLTLKITKFRQIPSNSERLIRADTAAHTAGSPDSETTQFPECLLLLFFSYSSAWIVYSLPQVQPAILENVGAFWFNFLYDTQ
jgi:hypothetical protein